ncbi:MAG: FkbM family methyltransferase [Planctomycetota bacterium]
MTLATLITLAGKVPLLGSILRRIAHSYPEGSITTIRSGVGQGLKWRRYHRYVNGYWLGQYELPLQLALRNAISPGMTVFDVGANAGFFSVIAAGLTGPTGKCVAFDPLTENVASIREQFALNGFAHGQVFEGAAGEENGRASIAFQESNNAMAHLGTPGRDEKVIEVELLTLDEAMRRFGRPHVVKVGVEGAELAVLRGAARLVQNFRPTWILEVHDPNLSGRIREALGMSYGLFTLEGDPIPLGDPLASHVIARDNTSPSS